MTHLHLSQYEQFFKKHKDLEVRKKASFLIGLIDQLEAALLVTSNWGNWPTVKGKTRMDQIKMMVLLHAIDRHQGRKDRAAKWLGISRPGIYRTIDAWNKQPIPKHETIPINLGGNSLIANANSLPNHSNGTTARECTKRAPPA